MTRFPRTAIIAIAILLQAAAILLGWTPYLGAERTLAGPDGYMRLLQVEALWSGGGWYGRLSPLTNAPFGEVLHWTRPFDLLLLACAWPLSAFVEPREALYLAGYFVSPLLQLVAVAVLVRGLIPALGAEVALTAGVLFCLQPVLRGVFMAAQPDHHSLQMLLFVAVFALTVRLAVAGPRPGQALLAGILGGLALWVSVEGLITLAVALLGLGIFWLGRGGAWGEAIRRLLWGFAAATTIAFLLDRPPAEWGAVEYDRVSVVHLTLALSMVLAWEAASRWPVPRIAQAAGTAALAAMIMFVIFPRFFGGPFVDVDPRLPAEWSDWIGEAKPLWPTSPEVAARFFLDLGPLWVALPALVWSFRKGAAEGERNAAVLFLVLLAVLVPLGLSQERLAAYPEAVLAAPWAMGLAALFRASRLPLAARAIAIPVGLTGHLFVAGHFHGVAEEGGTLTPPRRSCDWAKIAPTIRELASVEGRRLTVLSYVHQGPEIVYRTGQAVVGSPFQRNHAGILDTHAALRSTDWAVPRRILAERGVDLVAVCRDGSEAERYRDHGDNLFRRALEGGEPAWLVRPPLPAGVGESFSLLLVKREEIPPTP